MANYLSFAAAATALGPWVVQRPDVIYVYNLVTLSWAWRLIRKLRGCAVVLDIQDLWPESVLASKMMRSGVLTRLLSAWCRRAYRSADRLTVLSPGFKRHLTALGIPAERIDVIYNWCEESKETLTTEEAQNLRRRYGFENRFNLLFAGTMGRAQALGSVIEAARVVRTRAPRVLFTFVGGGVEVDSLKQEASGLDNVQFLPRCTPGEAAAIASVADTLLVHLKRDPLFEITIPSKTQTYLFAGKPIIMAVGGDAADLVREAEAGVCCSAENLNDLADAIIEMAAQPESVRVAMGQRGREYYLRRLSFEAGVSAFERVFAIATGRSPV
jgi:glycosyltransferase involved in cell wall biosynthesis